MPAPGLQNAFEGRVASLAFMGDRRIYQIEVAGGNRW